MNNERKQLLINWRALAYRGYLDAMASKNIGLAMEYFKRVIICDKELNQI